MPHDKDSDSGQVDTPKPKHRVALVEGDVTVDWHIATPREPSQSSLWHKEDERVPVVARAGGASLLGQLIEGVARSVPDSDWEVVYRPTPTGSNGEFPRLYTVWNYYKHPVAASAWRVSKFLGSDSPQNPGIPQPLTSAEPPDLIVVDDKGHRFRHEPTWFTQTIAQSNPTSWFLIRTGRPLTDQGLWKQLRNHPAKVIAVITADDVRRSDVFVSRKLSWERTTQDLYKEILENRNPALSQFAGCNFLVVCFTASAVVVIENPQLASGTDRNELPPPRCWLIYDPGSLEDEEWRDTANGRIYGYTYCVIAAIAHYLFGCLPGTPDAGEMSNAIKNGLTASRNLYEKGFEMDDEGISFPVSRVVQEVTDNSKSVWGVVEVPERATDDTWTLFETQARHQNKTLDELANRLVREGLDDLRRELPFYKVGDLIVADRREVEGFRSIQRLLKEYGMPRAGTARPLSIAVFGPPGCGKSFGIEQLAKSEMGGVGFAPLTFNLSQLTNPEDLRGAFHQIRDKSLSGKLPLVFWDEFDTALNDTELGWLRFFLAPMQDGRFRESQTEHFIGRAIFVFAGGTKNTMEEFCSDMNSDDDEIRERARNNKTPDFVSRLRGYLNVLGLNPMPSPAEDPLYVVRRAIILRSQLEKMIGSSRAATNGSPGKIDIDDGVLYALLHVNKYKHGVRSMEAAISMSLLSDRDRFERSSLPLEAQLNLHVDAKEFVRLLITKA